MRATLIILKLNIERLINEKIKLTILKQFPNSRPELKMCKKCFE